MTATTIEQSRQLIELGLNPKTADMTHKQVSHNLSDHFEWELEVGLDTAVKYGLFSYRNGYVVPAWSLEALLRVMPITLSLRICGFDYNHVMCLTRNAEHGWCVYYESKIWDAHVQQGSSPVEAAYKMVCWLLENGHIGTKGFSGSLIPTEPATDGLINDKED